MRDVMNAIPWEGGRVIYCKTVCGPTVSGSASWVLTGLGDFNI